MDGYEENLKGPANIYSKESKENLRSYSLMLPHIKICEGAYKRNERHRKSNYGNGSGRDIH
jgi:hypothetical protein